MKITILILVCVLHGFFQSTDYDPSTTSDEVTVQDAEFVYGDNQRKVPLKIYLPKSTSKVPVILFSHGLGGSKDNNPYLGKHWAGRGYVVVFMQHDGSDENVWRDVPRAKRLSTLKRGQPGEHAGPGGRRAGNLGSVNEVECRGTEIRRAL